MGAEASDPERAARADELKRLNGIRELRTWLAEGKETSLPNREAVISVIQDGKVTETAGNQTQESILRVDPTQQPKAIDCTMLSGKNQGVTYLGIYELRRDELYLCYALAGRPRPTAFASAPASGHYLATFRRVKS